MTISGHCFPQVHIILPQNLGSECYFGQRSLWAVYCRRNCFESVKIWRSRLGSSNFLIKTWFLSLLVCLFLLLNCSSWVADILMKSWIEKHYQGVNIKVWKDMRMNNILEKNFFCPWLIVTLVKEVFEQFTVGGTALRLSKFDIADLVLAIFWSRFWIILFFCSWHDYERTHSCHQSHQGVIRESSDINYTLIMFYEQNCVGRTSVSFSKFHSHCLIYL